MCQVPASMVFLSLDGVWLLITTPFQIGSSRRAPLVSGSWPQRSAGRIPGKFCEGIRAGEGGDSSTESEGAESAALHRFYRSCLAPPPGLSAYFAYDKLIAAWQISSSTWGETGIRLQELLPRTSSSNRSPGKLLETRLNHRVLRRPGYELQGARPFLSTLTVQLRGVG